MKALARALSLQDACTHLCYLSPESNSPRLDKWSAEQARHAGQGFDGGDPPIFVLDCTHYYQGK